MVCGDTLRIKHLPKELSEAQKEDFVRHFGAIRVKVITSKAKAKSIVYAKFENQDLAKNVMFRLHQLNVLNCRLCVEYAETDILQGALASKKITDLKDVPDQKFLKNFIKNVNAFNDSVGFHQPPPSHLKYNYPKANRSTINNIAHALATVPRFYTQVLHLMNKMNLPPPFAMPEPPVRIIQPSQHPVISQKPLVENMSEKRKESSSESEIESDGESNKKNEIIPQKRTLPQKKAVKRPKFIKQPVVQPSIPSKPVEKPEDIFEKVEVHPPRKIELRVMPELPPEPQKQEPVQKQDPIQKQITTQKDLESGSGHPKLLEKNIEPQGVKQKFIEKSKEQQETVSKKSVTVVAVPESTKSVDKFTKDQTMEISTQKVVDPIALRTPQKTVEKTKDILAMVMANPEPSQRPSVTKLEPEVEQNQSATELVETLNIAQKTNLQEPLQKQGGLLQIPQEHQEPRQKPKEIVQPLQEVESVETEVLPEPTSPEDDYPCISLEELAANQITDLTVMPVFKNYNPGEPTNKLYIKNCAKTVAVQDLEYIYNRYREDGTEDKPSEFNIRLMQEGRMKRQAFVTLDSVEMAQKAVRETNGFILKDKPLVVVFGKMGKKK